MPSVKMILDRKGCNVVTAAPEQSVLEAARLMNQHGIGAVIVMEAGKPVGIFTERDILRRVVAEQKDPALTRLGDVMTVELVTCRQDTKLEECKQIITERRIRHLPVVSDEGICGVITSGDILAFQVDDQAFTISHLSSYVQDMR